MLHRDVPLPAHGALAGGRAFELAACQPYGLADDGPRLDDADHTGHGDAADADHAGVVAENLLRAHSLDISVAVGAHQGDYHPPYEQRAGGDDESVAQAYDVAQAEHGCGGVAAHHQFGFLLDYLAPVEHGGLQSAGPQAESLHDVVVEAADERCYHQHFGLGAAFLAGGLSGCEHLGCGGGFGEGVLLPYFLCSLAFFH